MRQGKGTTPAHQPLETSPATPTCSSRPSSFFRQLLQGISEQNYLAAVLRGLKGSQLEDGAGQVTAPGQQWSSGEKKAVLFCCVHIVDFFSLLFRSRTGKKRSISTSWDQNDGMCVAVGCTALLQPLKDGRSQSLTASLICTAPSDPPKMLHL